MASQHLLLGALHALSTPGASYQEARLLPALSRPLPSSREGMGTKLLSTLAGPRALLGAQGQQDGCGQRASHSRTGGRGQAGRRHNEVCRKMMRRRRSNETHQQLPQLWLPKPTASLRGAPCAPAPARAGCSRPVPAGEGLPWGGAAVAALVGARIAAAAQRGGAVGVPPGGRGAPGGREKRLCLRPSG